MTVRKLLSFNVCRLLTVLIALKDMGDESLVGIVDLVSGERDPRNLMLIFSILRVLMLEWDISNNVQVRVFSKPVESC